MTLDQRKDLAGLVIRSAKPGMFIAGADLKEFAAWLDAPKEEVAELLPPRAAALWAASQSRVRHRGGDRWHMRRRRRGTGDVVRSANLH